MFPEITRLDIEKEPAETTQLGTSFFFDFSRGDFLVRDGRLVKCQDIEALKIWVNKMLKTEKFRYKIYERTDENEYGVILEDLLIGRDYPPAFVESELKREIEAALLRHPLIGSLSDWRIKKASPLVVISFRVNLVNGSFFDKEVNI